MQETFNYNLKKPDYEEFGDVEILNENFDTIDEALAEVGKSADDALTNAKKYTDEKIKTIPTPDVNGQIEKHNTASDAHAALFKSVNSIATAAKTAAEAAQTNVNRHIADKNNPHNVTADQVGAAAKDLSNVQFGLAFKNATLPSYVNWTSVCYGNGKFVAVTYGSTTAAYSTDGITWTIATLPSSAKWYSVCYGNGKFVAVTYGSTTAAYSTDGITWTIATLPSTESWQSVCYGNGKFIAVASSSNKAAYSTDGITWTIATLPRYAYWYSVCYGDGKFVAVAGLGTTAAYSTDGITWTIATLPSTESWQSVCYGDGKFVAVAHNNSKIAYSTDGITWTEATPPSSEYWQSVCYGNGKFVAVTYGSNKAAYSTDGITWTIATLPSSAKWYSVCYGNGKFVAVAYNSNKAAYADASPSIVEQLCGSGMARIQELTYVGTGTYGSDNPNTLTFDFTPRVILIQASDSPDFCLCLLNGAKNALGNITRSITSTQVVLPYVPLLWSGKTVSWYYRSGPGTQLNALGTTYIVKALG